MSYNGFHDFARHSIMLFLSQERLYSGLYIKLKIRGEAKQSILFTNQKTQCHRKKIERGGGARLTIKNLDKQKKNFAKEIN